MNKDENKKKKHSKDTPFSRVPKMTVFDKNLTVYDIAVLNSICSFINSKDDSWAMTRKAIAERAHMGTKDLHAVDKCIKKLVSGGYLNFVSGGEGVANKYTVKFPKVDAELYTKGKKNTPVPVPVTAPAADSNVIPITRKKLPKKVLKAPANKQEPNNDIQCIVSHWIAKANSHNMQYAPTDKDAVAVSTLLDKHSLTDLKAIISFVWDVWDAPKEDLKANMNINILNTGYANSIINSYEQYKAGTYQVDFNKRQSDWSNKSNNDSKCRIFVDDKLVAGQKNTLNSSTKTDESLPKIERKKIR